MVRKEEHRGARTCYKYGRAVRLVVCSACEQNKLHIERVERGIEETLTMWRALSASKNAAKRRQAAPLEQELNELYEELEARHGFRGIDREVANHGSTKP
jgi:hypothetical protein